jgi:hypothetical protein
MGSQMKTKILAVLLLGAALALPAAVPASQPANIRLDALSATTVVVAPDSAALVTLLADPNRTAELSIELVDGYTTLEWINQDPFAL